MRTGKSLQDTSKQLHLHCITSMGQWNAGSMHASSGCKVLCGRSCLPSVAEPSSSSRTACLLHWAVFWAINFMLIATVVRFRSRYIAAQLQVLQGQHNSACRMHMMPIEQSDSFLIRLTREPGLTFEKSLCHKKYAVF